MKVGQLRDALALYDADIEIVLEGYEGGYRFATELEQIVLRLNAHTEWYYGPHEKDNGEDNLDKPMQACLLLV